MYRVSESFELESSYHEHQTSVTAIDANETTVISGDAKSTLCIRQRIEKVFYESFRVSKLYLGKT